MFKKYYFFIKYDREYLKEGDKILDIGAGTDVYSIYFAVDGCSYPDFWLSNEHNHDTFEIYKSSFKLYTVEECRSIIEVANFEIQKYLRKCCSQKNTAF